MILALCLLVSMLSVAVLAEDGTDITGTIQFTVSGYSGVYDGEAHSISVNVTSPEGASVSYAYPTEGEYGSQNPAFTNAGEYKVAYMIAKESYATQTDIATVAIERADVSDAVKSTLKSNFTYDGNPVQLAPFHEGIESWEMAYCDADGTSLSAAPSDPGSYSVKISGYGANYYAHVDHSFTIDEPEKEIEYSVEGFDVDYDGKPHSISLTVRTDGVSVRYATAYEGPYGETNPSFTEAGMYVVYYRLEKQGYKSEEGSVTVEIHAIDISDDVKATLPGSFTCTGAPVQFNLPTDKIQEWSVEYYQGDLSLESAPSVPGSYTATISGESGNYRASISHSFTIVEAEALPVIQYSVSSYSGYYDGQAHSIALNVATEGVTATFATSEDGAYTATQPSFTESGEYTVWFRLEKEGYETVVGSANVTIKELAQIDYSVQGFNGYYDGKAHTIALNIATEGVTATFATSEDGAYTATQPSFTEPGEYTVWFKLEKENCETVVDSASVTIMKLGKIEYTVSDYSGYYDGKAHTISLNIATEGVSVTYATSEDGAYSATLPSFTETGTYTVWFKLEKENCETVVDSASVTITELGKIEYTVSNYSGYYDGKAHTITLNVATEGVTATYATSEDGAYSAALPSFTEPGTYTVWFKLEKAGYETVVDFATVTIMELGKIEYSVQDYSGYDDGEAHSITLNVITEGVTATFATSEGGEYSADMPSFTDIGTYTVWFKLEKEGYETVVDSATVAIAKPGTILYTVEDYSGYYDGKPHSISLNVLTEGVDVTYSEKSSVVSKTLPMFTDPGYYIVRFLLEKVGYATTYGTGSVTIDPGVIEYSARGYSGYADGKAHSIQLYVSTPDAKVSYATSEGGEYSADKPSFSEVGTHTVWYRIEKEHYATVEGSEVVKLLQPKQDSIVYSVEDYVGAYDGEAHTIALDVTTPNVNVTYATSRDGEYGATLPSFTEPGTHTVWFRLKKSGYETSTGSATVTIEKAEQVLYFEQSVKTILPSKDSEEIPFVSHCLCHDQGDGALSWSFSDPDRMSLRSGNLFWGTLSIDVPYAEWSKGYSATVTATAAETDHYKAATATLTIVAISSIQAEYSASSGSGSAADVMHYMSKQQVTNQMQETIQMQDIDLTVSPVSTLDNQSLLSASNELRKKLMASAGAGQIGSMAVDATLIDTQTGAELHSTNGDLTLMLTGVLQQKYLENYKEMACYAVHLKQDSTTGSTAASTGTSTNGQGVNIDSQSFIRPGGTIDTSGSNADGSGVYAGSFGFTMDGGNIDTTTTGTSGSTAVSQDTNGSNTTTGTSGSTAASQDTNGSNTTTGTSGSTAASQDTDGSNTNAADNALEVNIGLGLNGTGNNSRVYESYLRIQDDLRNPAGLGDDSSASSNEGQLLVSTHNDLTVVPTGSFSPTVEYIPCELTERGVRIPDTSLSPFLLIYGPKEAFSNLLTVRAKDGVFTYDGEGHAVAAEPSIVEGTTLYYSLDLESWQTEAPSFTDVLWNEDGSVGSYQVYVLAENPDCDPAVCSYTVTILPEA